MIAVTGAAQQAGLLPGDLLQSVEGHRLRDVIDFYFYADGPVADFEVLRGEETFTVKVRRDQGDSWGIEFAEPLFDGLCRCNNNCIFCFLKQQPQHWRRTLYLRDDDYRLSFLFGNFITLTNLHRGDWLRLDEQRLSPLFVSVHATDPELRRFLLGKKKLPDIRQQLARLERLGITVHAQVVVCPGINDGAHLEKTIADLERRSAAVHSVALVPVGLTRFRDLAPAGLDGTGAQLRPHTLAEARAVLRWAIPLQRAFRARLGRSFVYLSDEFYLLARNPPDDRPLAGLSVPTARFYDGFPQLENGVGRVRLLRDDWFRTRRRLGALVRPRTVTLVCGTLIAPTLRRMAVELSLQVAGLGVEVLAVENQTFGPMVTVSGLLTGGDFLAALRGADLGEMVFLPRVAFEESGTYTLDDVSVEQIQEGIGRPVVLVDDMSEVVAEIKRRDEEGASGTAG